MAAKRVRDKQIVLNHYGRACVCCGEDTFEFLTLDHKNNDGAEHRRQIAPNGIKDGSVYRWLIKNGFPPIVQTMCMNCNWAKGKYGECPHTNIRLLSFVG